MERLPSRALALLYPADDELSPEARRRVQLYRLFCLCGALLLLLFGPVHGMSNPDVVDPIWARVGVTGILAGLFTASYVSTNVRRSYSWWMRGAFYVLLGWFSAIAALNGFSVDYTVGLLLLYAALVAAAGLGINAIEPVLWFAVTGVLMVGVALAAAPTAAVNPVILLVGLAALAGVETGTIYLFLRTHQKYKRKEERLRTITENVSDGIYRSAPGEGLVYANQALADMFGFESPEEMLREDPESLYADAEARRQVRDKAYEEGGLRTAEVEYRRRDGTTFPGLVTDTVVWDEDGTPRYHDGVVTEFTERKQFEQELRESKRRWQRLVEKLQLGIHITIDGEIRYVNPAGARILGAEEPSAVVGRPLRQFLTSNGEQEDVLNERAEKVQAGAKTDPYEYEIIGLDGERRIVEAYSVPTRFEGEQALQAAFHNVTEQKALEKRLRRRGAQLKGIADSIPGVIFQFYVQGDATYGVHFVGQQAEAMLGISPAEDGFFDRFTQRIPESHREAFLSSIREPVDEGRKWRKEVPFERPDGERVWLLCASRREERGSERVFNGVLLDITEQKRAETRAQLQTQVLRQVAEGAPLKNVLAGLIDGLESLRPGMLGSVLLYDATEEVLTHGAAPSLPEEYIQGIDGIEVGPQTGSCGTAVHTGSEVRTPDVKTDPRWDGYRALALEHGLRACWSIPIRDSRGEMLGTFAMYFEEPLRPSAQDEALLEEARSLARIAIERHHDKRRRRLLSGAIEQSSEAVVITEAAPLDEPGPRIEYVNPAFEEMSGYQREEIIGKTPRVLQGPETDRDVLDSLREALEAGQTWSGDTVNYKKDGSAYHVEWAVAPLKERSGDIEYWVSVQRDVTKARRRKQELTRAKEAAEDAARLKTAMLANMSHEIRTPLTSVTGFAEILKDELDGQPGTFAEKIHQGGERLQKTLDSVLQLSQLEAGTYEMDKARISLGEVLKETVDLLGQQADREGLTLTTEIDGRLVGRWNEAALNRIAENLIENAIKFTPKGGTITVRARRAGEDEAVLEVEDTGIGISEEALPQIFQAFKQESEGVDREFEGTGLGLSIVRRLVDAHDGTIDVESEKTQGTCFSIRLPRYGGERE